MKIKHKNIPIFIPHEGCPNCCVFCSQRKITGVKDTVTTLSKELERCEAIIEESLETINTPESTEIAFFGGSFTAIDETRMIELLRLAYKYVENGKVSGIRLSTRPDYIDEHKLSILKKYGVKAVELGVQSMSEKVLVATKRGHSPIDSIKSGRLIVQSGIEYVGQMMIGLPESTLSDELMTAKSIIDSGAVGARIYPTVVIEGTELYEMYQNGKYTPLTIEESVARCAEVLELFETHGVKVLRIGLQSSSEMEKNPFYHSAIGELAWGRLYYKRISELIKDREETNITVLVSPSHVSKAVGQKRENVLKLELESGKKIKIKGDAALVDGATAIEKTK